MKVQESARIAAAWQSNFVVGILVRMFRPLILSREFEWRAVAYALGARQDCEVVLTSPAPGTKRKASGRLRAGWTIHSEAVCKTTPARGRAGSIHLSAFLRR